MSDKQTLETKITRTFSDNFKKIEVSGHIETCDNEACGNTPTQYTTIYTEYLYKKMAISIKLCDDCVKEYKKIIGSNTE